jgi:hypothetical protein
MRMRAEEHIPGSKHLDTTATHPLRNIWFISLTTLVTKSPAIHTIPAPLGPIWLARSAAGQRLVCRTRGETEVTTSASIALTYCIGLHIQTPDPGCCHPQDSRPQLRQEPPPGDRPAHNLHPLLRPRHPTPPNRRFPRPQAQGSLDPTPAHPHPPTAPPGWETLTAPPPAADEGNPLPPLSIAFLRPRRSAQRDALGLPIGGL